MIIVLIGIFNLVKNGKCNTYAYVWYFNTDKATYYNDEEICINASWDLDYDGGVSSYIQIKIFDENWELLWNSSKYDQKGTNLEGEWYVKITDLPLPFNNTSNSLIITFFYYLNTGSVFVDYMEIRYANTIKRNITCELFDFNPSFTYGDIFDFTAKFYYTVNNTALSNYIINVKFKSNNKITFNKNYTTNSSGLIYVSIPSFNFSIGENTLIINIMENIFHYSSSHDYQLFINSLPPIPLDNDDKTSEPSNDYSIIIYSTISIASIVFVVSLYLYYTYFNKKKVQYIKDITFKF